MATNGSSEHESANQCEYACIQCSLSRTCFMVPSHSVVASRLKRTVHCQCVTFDMLAGTHQMFAHVTGAYQLKKKKQYPYLMS